VKEDEDENPSMKEVVMGIYLHHMLTVERTFSNLKEKGSDIGLYRNSMKKAFNQLLLCLDMGDEDIDEPLSEDIYEDPNSPQVQLILTMYSMEPPFYADLNNACRTLDPAKLKTLGPFAKAIFEVLLFGNESDVKREDALEQG